MDHLKFNLHHSAIELSFRLSSEGYLQLHLFHIPTLKDWLQQMNFVIQSEVIPKPTAKTTSLLAHDCFPKLCASYICGQKSFGHFTKHL